MTLAEMVKQQRIMGGGSVALGVPVTFVGRGDLAGRRDPLGVIVEIGAEGYGVWVRRFTDPADVQVLYPLSEVEVATQADLASIARTMLAWQYRETAEVRRSHPAG